MYNLKRWAKYSKVLVITLILILAFASLALGASKPSVSTSSGLLANPTATTATIGGTVTSLGSVTDRGVYYGTSSNPSSTGTKVSAGAGGFGPYSVSLTGLTPSTKYYFCAYATNSAGTSYGSVDNFTTLAPTLPAVTTSAGYLAFPTATTATVGGIVTFDGNATVTDRGVYYGTSSSPVTTGTNCLQVVVEPGSIRLISLD